MLRGKDLGFGNMSNGWKACDENTFCPRWGGKGEDGERVRVKEVPLPYPPETLHGLIKRLQEGKGVGH